MRHIDTLSPTRKTAVSAEAASKTVLACEENPVCAVIVPPVTQPMPAAAPTQPSHRAIGA